MKINLMKHIRNQFNWKDLLIVATYSFFFLILCKIFIDFTLDDAFITFRYSQNLATGNGPVWNIGEDPVEGYTTFLWMVLMAIFIKLGQNPVVISKVISIIAGLSTIFLIYFYSRQKKDNRIIPTLVVAGIALNPAFAFMAVQGTGTILASLLVLFIIILSIRLVSKYSKFETIIFSLLLLLAFLTRPDLIVFELLIIGCMIILLYRRYEKSTFYNFLLNLFIFLIIPGFVYMAWRINFFGYFFPNAFYVKKSEAFLSLSGLVMVFHYLTLVIGPYIILALYSLIKTNLKKGQIQLKEYFPALISLFVFLTVYFFIDPIQGFLYRFQMPTLPSFLLLFSLCMPGISIPKIDLSMKPLKRGIKSAKLLRLFLILVLCSLIIVFPLHTMDDAISEKTEKTQFDRVVVGKELAKLADKNYTMFVTESGALPYYSKWKAVDHWGLNDEYIAHNGLTIEYLEIINPELIMAQKHPQKSFKESLPIVHEFMVKNNYTAVAAIKRSEKRTHLYFSKPSVQEEIAECILNIPVLEYRNIHLYVGDEIPVWRD